MFIDDLASRLAVRVQLTTDGRSAYLSAVEGAFGADVDHAMLVKPYGEPPEVEKRCSPAIRTGATKHAIAGRPEKEHVSTSYVERQNLTMRMRTRRFTRTAIEVAKHFGLKQKLLRRALRKEEFAWHAKHAPWTVSRDGPEHNDMLRVAGWLARTSS